MTKVTERDIHLHMLATACRMLSLESAQFKDKTPDDVDKELREIADRELREKN